MNDKYVVIDTRSPNEDATRVAIHARQSEALASDMGTRAKTLAIALSALRVAA